MPAATHLIKIVFGLAVAATALSACQTTQPAPRGFNAASFQSYTLDTGDRLRITVFDQQGLTNTYTVDQSGYISFPLIGQVAARGKTLQQLSGEIAAKLRQGYVRDPDVTIDVDRYRSIYIMGEVGQPGQYSYVPGMTIQNAIAVAGGYTSRADKADADISRKINGRVITGRVRTSDPVIAGDTIYVRERLF